MSGLPAAASAAEPPQVPGVHGPKAGGLMIAYAPPERPVKSPTCGGGCRLVQVILPGRVGRSDLLVCDAIHHERVGRASNGVTREPVIRTGTLVVDRYARALAVDGREVHVTAREWAVLDHFAANLDRLCSVDEILSACWGPEYLGAGHMVYVNVNRLRARLGTAAPLIENLHGHGWRLRSVEPVEPGQSMRLLRGPTPWAGAWDHCRECGTTERAHDSHGRCTRCASRLRKRRRRA